MPHDKTVRLYRASAAGNTPGPLAEGELALDALSNPPRLYTPVPTSRDPSGRIDLLAGTQAELAALAARCARLEQIVEFYIWRSRVTPPVPAMAMARSEPSPAGNGKKRGK